MRSHEVRGRTGRAVRKKSRTGEGEEGGWAADMTCYRFGERDRKVGQIPKERRKFLFHWFLLPDG